MIPCVSYLDLVPPDITTLSLERDAHVSGNVSPFEIDVINKLVKFYASKTIFEIGTFDGRTTLNLAAHSPSDAQVYTLDLPQTEIDATALRIDQGDRLFINKPRSGVRFQNSEVAQKIIQLYGDSAKFDFSPYFNKIDFLFVDGSHSYDYVIQDSKTALNLIREDGIILWHDYVRSGPTPWPGLGRAIDELFSNDSRFRNMKHIAGTAIVILKRSGNKVSQSPVLLQSLDAPLTSEQPEYLLATLEVAQVQQPLIVGAPIKFRIRATNTGRAIWLPSDAPQGPVRLGSRLLSEEGVWLNAYYSCSHFLDRKVSPGETVNFEALIPCPPKGIYILELDLVADGVAWFSRNGATEVQVPLRVNKETAKHRFDFHRWRRKTRAWASELFRKCVRLTSQK